MLVNYNAINDTILKGSMVIKARSEQSTAGKNMTWPKKVDIKIRFSRVWTNKLNFLIFMKFCGDGEYEEMYSIENMCWKSQN